MLKPKKTGMTKSEVVGFSLAFCAIWGLLLVGLHLSTLHWDDGLQNIAGIRDYKAGHYNAAIQELSIYLKAHPTTPLGGFKMRTTSDDAQYFLAQALRKKHRYAEAEDAFRVYARCSAEEEGDYMLGKTLLEDNKPVEARAAFQKVIDTDQMQDKHGHSWHLVDLSKAELAKMNQPH